MNPEQAARQIKDLLETVTWPGGSQNVVFGGNGRVKIYAGSPTEDQVPVAYPAALVGIGPGTPDQDIPSLINQQFTVTAAVLVAGDPMGENAVIGGPSSDYGKSAGKGVTEVAERVRFAIQDIVGVDGVKIKMTLSTTDTPINLTGKHLVTADLVVTMWCTSQLYMAPVQEIALSETVWTWEGTQCRNRFDFVGFQLGTLTGSTPSADVSDYTLVGSVVTVDTLTQASVAGAVNCIFAHYSRHGTTSEVKANSSRGDRVGSFLVL